MGQIRFLPKNCAVEFKEELSILDVALKHGVEINHSCGGMGSCGTCRVIVTENLHLLADRNEIEQEMADHRGFQSAERLSCQTKPQDVVIKVPDTVSEPSDRNTDG